MYSVVEVVEDNLKPVPGGEHDSLASAIGYAVELAFANQSKFQVVKHVNRKFTKVMYEAEADHEYNGVNNYSGVIIRSLS